MHTERNEMFGGSDVITIVDGQLNLEITDIKWDKLLDGNVKGEISVVVLTLGTPFENLFNKRFDIQLLFCNESKATKAYVIEGVKLISMKGGISLDTICEEMVFTFTARDVRVHDDYEFKIERQVAYVQEFERSRDEQISKLVELYKANILRMVLHNSMRVIPDWELKSLRNDREDFGKLKQMMQTI